MSRIVVVLLTLIAPAVHAAELSCVSLPLVVDAALANHLEEHALSDTLRRRTVERFVELAIEEHRYVLTAPVVASLRTAARDLDLPAIDLALRSGDCAFFEGLQKQVSESRARALALLGPEDELVKAVVAQLAQADATHIGGSFAPDEASMRAYFIQEATVAAKSWLDQAEPELAAKHAVARMLMEPHGVHVGAATRAAEAFNLALDPHSEYFDEEAHSQFEASLDSQTEGIVGVVVETEATPHGILIDSLTPGTSAAKSGKIHAGDVIVSVDGITAFGADFERAREAISGPEGTRVKLVVGHVEGHDVKDLRTVRLVRRELTRAATTVTTERRVIDGKTLLVVRMEEFHMGVASAVADAIILEESRAPFDAVVLDLRGNPGGFVHEALDVIRLFVADGPILQERSTFETTVHRDDGGMVAWDGPLVVAIDEASASASELVAGSLQDLGRARIVGRTSYGKGSIQRVFDVDGAGAVKVTVGRFYTPRGHSNQGRGVIPDVRVVGKTETESERDEPYALAPDEVSPAADLVMWPDAPDEAVVRAAAELVSQTK